MSGAAEEDQGHPPAEGDAAVAGTSSGTDASADGRSGAAAEAADAGGVPVPPSATAAASATTPACIVVGMAGSGKTTLLHRLSAYSQEQGRPSYFINLDPAALHVPYPANVDIRDTIKYKEVMKEYQLGPNGGIMTSLNLFSTKFEQVLRLCEQRAPDVEHIFFDTPGQIEVFTWSASGALMTESLASTFPTVLLYVVDTPRSADPTTFMSNMMYACSILYKTRLPFVVVFNKTDVLNHGFAEEWMSDFDAFQDALDKERSKESYMTSLTRSMSLVLDEFYTNLRRVGVSAATGLGMEDLMEAIDGAVEEYRTTYLPDLERRRAHIAKQDEARRQRALANLQRDLARDGHLGEGGAASAAGGASSAGGVGVGAAGAAAGSGAGGEEEEPRQETYEGEREDFEAVMRHVNASKGE